MERLVGAGSCFIRSNRCKTKLDRHIWNRVAGLSDTEPSTQNKKAESNPMGPDVALAGVTLLSRPRNIEPFYTDRTLKPSKSFPYEQTQKR